MLIYLHDLVGELFGFGFGTGNNKQSLKQKNTNCLLNEEYMITSEELLTIFKDDF